MSFSSSSSLPPGLPPSELIGYSVQRLVAASPEADEWHVTLHHPAELTEFVRRQFTPHLCPEYADATLSELLWAFLPALYQRFGTPEQWRSRRLLLPPQERAAQTLSFRLQAEGHHLPHTFSVPHVLPQEITAPPPTPQRSFLSALLSRLPAWLTQPPEQPPGPSALPVPSLLTGTQVALLSSPAVVHLRQVLQANLQQAEQQGDARWRYHAKAALTEYLPETVQLHGERGGQPDDPEFLRALAHIRTIALSPPSEKDRRWQAHQRFLEEKAREGR